MLPVDLIFLFLSYLSRPSHQRLSLVNQAWSKKIRDYYRHWSQRSSSHWLLKDLSEKERASYLFNSHVEGIYHNFQCQGDHYLPLRLFSALASEPVFLTWDEQLYLEGRLLPVTARQVTHFQGDQDETLYLILDREGAGYIYGHYDGLVLLNFRVKQVEKMVILTDEGEIHFCFSNYLILEPFLRDNDEKVRFVQIAVSYEDESESFIYLTALTDQGQVWVLVIEEEEVIMTLQRINTINVTQISAARGGLFLLLLENGWLEVSYYFYNRIDGVSRLTCETVACPPLMTEQKIVSLWGPGLREGTYYVVDNEFRIWVLDLRNYELDRTELKIFNCPSPGEQESYCIEY